MKKIVMICPPLQGHLNPMKSIAYLLLEKGIKPVFIGIADSSNLIDNFEHFIIGKKAFPKGSLEIVLRKISQSRGVRMGRMWQKIFLNKWCKVVCEELPSILEHLNADLMVIDQLDPASALVADKCNIKFITACNAMTIVLHRDIPLFYTSWDYTDKPSYFRDVLQKWMLIFTDLILKNDNRILEKYRRKWNMDKRIGMNRYFAMSKIATFSQQSPLLEFPLTDINKNWNYCGPIRSTKVTNYNLPLISKDDVINVYISLGSIQGSRFKLLKKTAKSCKELGLRPIIAHAGRLEKNQIRDLEEYALVFDYVKQPDIFDMCDLLISHCGLNTVLDALSFGRPIIAMPLGIEQAAIATKVTRTGSGIRIKRFSRKNIKKAIMEITSNPEYRLKAELIKMDIKKCGGSKRAVNIILDNL